MATGAKELNNDMAETGLDYADSEDAARLRTQLRRLIRKEIPDDFLGAFTSDPRDLAVAQGFCKTLAEEKLLAMAWPIEYGGRGSSVWEQTVFREEMWAHFEPRGAQYMGVNWVGPAIMRFGTAAQKAEHLPRIAGGDVIWCQGFSEPDAGSDLASLKTAAVSDGDSWRIHGQKIWTSYATMAQWCFLLARTSSGAAKQHGITVFLIPMDQPGIEVRPISSMVGPHHLNEVFFDGALARSESVLGEVDHGWSVVREALAFERVGIARYARSDRLLSVAPSVIGARWEALPAVLKQRWANALVHARQARLLAYKVLALQEEGDVDPGDAAAYRIAVTRLDQETAEVLMDILEEASVGDYRPNPLFGRAVTDHWLYAQAATVASGSIEIQRVLLSRAILGPSS